MDIQQHYIERGEGEVLILLHGNGEDVTYFEHQINYFSKKYRVIALDTRGHGKTKRGEAPFTIRQFAEDLHEFLKEKNIDKVNLLGFSDGGNIAMIFAMKYPENVKKLILNGANLDGSGVKFLVQFPILLGYYFAAIFARRSKEAKKNAEMLGLMVKDPNVKVQEPSKISMPTLVIAGNKDMIKDSHTRLIGRHIPNAKTVILEGDHFVANKRPEIFNQEVEQFLDA